MPPYLSVVIPAFNEADRIGPTLDAVDAHLRTASYAYEIIVVDDGSTDATAVVVNQRVQSIPHLSLMRLPKNSGKGAAVRAGLLAAQGQWRLFTDADNSTSIEQVEKLLAHTDQYDVIVGSRQVAGADVAIKQGLLRETLGAIFRTITHLIVPLPIRDTQNGFKLFSAEAAERVFTHLSTVGWSFDVEALRRAQKLGLRIIEVPIVWKNDGRSRVRVRHMPRMLLDLFAIRWYV